MMETYSASSWNRMKLLFLILSLVSIVLMESRVGILQSNTASVGSDSTLLRTLQSVRHTAKTTSEEELVSSLKEARPRERNLAHGPYPYPYNGDGSQPYYPYGGYLPYSPYSDFPPYNTRNQRPPYGRPRPPPRRKHYDDDYYYDDDDDYYYYREDYYFHFDFVYKPVDPAFIKNVTGGMGGRNDRALEDIRFNKMPPVIDDHWTSAWRYKYSREYTNGVHVDVFPLLPKDYPLKEGDLYDLIRTQTMADSPMIDTDYALHGTKFEDYLDYLKDHHYPSSDPANPYWEELEHVVDMQIARRANKDPNAYNRWPDLWKEFDMTKIAEAVHSEYPGSLQQAFLYKIFKKGIVTDYDIMPFRSVNDFVAQEVMLAKLNTWAVERISPTTFLNKWHFGVPRAEEMAWLIAIGDFTVADGIPQRLVDKILSMNLKHAHDFTAYEDGCPMHPSFPAMHAAKSTVSTWLPIILKLTPGQYCEALRTDFAVAYARTIAGVHYKMDDYAGLNLGQQIIINSFPSFMEEGYGCDAEKIRKKMKFLSFDWHDFDPYKCTIEGTPVGGRLQAYYAYYKKQKEAEEEDR